MPGKYTQFPNGIYKLSMTNVDLGEASTGTPFLAIQADINRCVKTIEGKPFVVPAGSRTVVKMYLSEKTREKTIAWLRAAGFEEGRSFNDLKISAANHFTGKGFEFDASAKNEKYVNKDNVEDNFCKFEAFPVKGSNIKPISSNSLAKLDALFGGGKKKTASAPSKEESPFNVGNESDSSW